MLEPAAGVSVGTGVQAEHVQLNGTKGVVVGTGDGHEMIVWAGGAIEDAGNYCDIYDSDYMTKGKDFPGALVPPKALRNYMPEEKVARREAR